MFISKKQKRYLNEVQQTLEQIQKEKKELELIKALLTDNSPKIDISNIYTFQMKGIYYIVEKNKTPQYIPVNSKKVFRYQITLKDIFTNKILYDKIHSTRVEDNTIQLFSPHVGYYTTHIHPITSFDKSLLVFADKQVPLCILQQMYYKLNNIDITENEYANSLTSSIPPNINIKTKIRRIPLCLKQKNRKNN